MICDTCALLSAPLVTFMSGSVINEDCRAGKLKAHTLREMAISPPFQKELCSTLSFESEYSTWSS